MMETEKGATIRVTVDPSANSIIPVYLLEILEDERVVSIPLTQSELRRLANEIIESLARQEPRRTV